MCAMGARGSGRRGRTEDGGGGQQPGQPVVVRLVRQSDRESAMRLQQAGGGRAWAAAGRVEGDERK